MKPKIFLVMIAFCLFGGNLIGCNQGGMKLKVRLDDIGKLKSGDRVYQQENVVGVVTEVTETDDKRFLAAVTLKKETAEKATRQDRFYIDQDPKESDRSAVIMIGGKKGGEPLKEGDIVDGAGPAFVLFQRLQKDAQKGLMDVKTQFDQFARDLKSIPESEEFRQLKEDVNALVEELVDKMNASGEATERTIRDEILPELEKMVETLREQLKPLGRENEIEPLETEIEKLRSNIN